MPFSAGAVVWVKCGALFWPGRIVGDDNVTDDLRESLKEEKRKPALIVKFFNEDGYEFLYDEKNVHAYNCDKKEAFVKKGIGECLTKTISSVIT